MILRPYQDEAVHAVYEHLQNREDNPCVVLPTGSGKSLVIARICSDAVLQWSGRVLILAHVKELLQQNADKLHRLAPDVKFGIYSAGLKSRRTKEPVIVAGIQSVYERACELGAFDLILVDESHLLPENGEGMYRTFLKEAKIVNPNVRLIGFTATPCRMTSGMICKPENLLNHVCYEKGVKELINEGYLCHIHTKVPAQKIDCSNLHVRNGEFRSDDVAELFSTENAVHSIFTDIFRNTKDRNKILIFCADVAQATLFQREIQRVAEVGLITGETPAQERAELIARFQDQPTGLLQRVEPLRWLVNVNVLTTGFDAPNIDCVVLARPTLSPGLYYQMVGRSLRNAPNKTDALVLDYGGNIQRHGCIDAINVKIQSGGNGGEAPIRECPECHTILPISVSRCAGCGYIFPIPESVSKLEEKASNEGILSGQTTEILYEVQDISYFKHYKKNGTPDDPPTLRIEYRVGFNEFVSKWVCPEHKGWAWSNKFVPWWKQHCNIQPPTTVDEALFYAEGGYLAVPKRLLVIKTSGQRFEEVIEQDFTEKPAPPESDYVHSHTCGDCALYDRGDCPYKTAMFGCELVCEHFVACQCEQCHYWNHGWCVAQNSDGHRATDVCELFQIPCNVDEEVPF
jgi:DNA repair protein RadD